jgi:hypothetical protein
VQDRSIASETTVRLRVVATPEANFQKCLHHGLWGSKTNRLCDWRPGDLVVFSLDKKIAALAEATNDPCD